jgi:hypothetical protein
LDYGYIQDSRRKGGVTDNREESKLRWWGLIEEELSYRPDGGRAGYWKVTGLGEAWINHEVTVPKYAHILFNELVFVGGDPITIDDALGKKFDLRELMTS